MSIDELKRWYACHAAAFPAFKRCYGSMTGQDERSHAWRFFQQDLGDITYSEAMDATEYMRQIGSELKPERHTREVARIANTKRLEAKDREDRPPLCELCHDTGRAVLFVGSCRPVLLKWQQIYGDKIKHEFQTFTTNCICSASTEQNAWLKRHLDGVVPGWGGVYGLTDEQKEMVLAGAETFHMRNGWSNPTGNEEMEF